MFVKEALLLLLYMVSSMFVSIFVRVTPDYSEYCASPFYLEHSDVPGKTFHSFIHLTPLESLLLSKSRQIFMEVHA